MKKPINNLPVHGGEIERLAREYGFAVEELLDFSANINPAPPPESVLERLKKDVQNIALLTRYPDLELSELRGVLAKHCGVQNSNIVIANGSAALIDATIRAVLPRKCLLPVPAFSEYARALRAFGCQIQQFPLSREQNFVLDVEKFNRELESGEFDFCIINNPHNPTGAMILRQNLEKLIRVAELKNVTVLLDEAFIDYQPDESLTKFADKYTNLIVMRSVTKFFSIPALRVGYAVTDEILAERLNEQISSWSVTTFAANAVCEVFKDEDFSTLVREQNEVEKNRFGLLLREIGLKVYPSSANFLLLELRGKHLNAAILFERLIINHKIIVRNCSSYDNLGDKFLRVAVRTKPENELFIVAVSECLKFHRSS
ncbi:MAG: pyridoxal phosphate-dependent class II aminotransferase [Pyrinomonadaceae bacterium]|nr:pyridoxal phosphate-dependent class II aminotransferase [Pyrinomonadaceae bacterium]